MGASETRGPVTPARVVLDVHTGLYESLKNPGSSLTTFLQDFMEAMFEDTKAQDAISAFAYMFWPCRTGVEYSSMLAGQLHSARTYQVTAEMMDAVTGTYEQVVGRVGHMEEREAPAQSGFCYFDKPLSFGSDSEKVSFRAISWCLQPIDFGDGDGAWPSVRITAWASVDDNDLDEYGPWGDRGEAKLREMGPLFLCHSLLYPFEERFVARLKGEDATLNDVTRWLHCLWMWLQAEITVTGQAPPEEVGRGARRRAQRSLKHDQVNVIILRRARSLAEPSGLHRHIDWSCRWPVQGHDRHLDKYEGPRHRAAPEGPDKHCAACGSRTTYVHAFIKGPDGLPLKSVEQLSRLAR
jgi:hypothetical protein